MKEEILSKFGLTKNEAKVYLTLLRIGTALAGEITAKSGVHRRNVYDAIERLIKKGLIGYIIQNNKKYFRAANPRRFLGIIKEQEQELKRREDLFNRILPELTLSKKLASNNQEVYFYKGPEGLKSVYGDILRTGQDYLGYGHSEQMQDVLRFFVPHFIEERRRKKIRAKLIYSERARKYAKSYSGLSTIKYLPHKFARNDAIRVYGNKVAILLLSKEEPFAIVINNKSIADGYRKQFNLMWRSAKK